ncbi:MAG: tetratricopeptide repeat protein [bacterium]
MKKELKRQIKQDELREGVQHAGQWAVGHSDELRIGVLVAAVIVVLVGGIVYFQQHRKAQAERAFSDAAQVYHAQVKGEQVEPAPAPTSGETYANDKEKYEKAKGAFEGVYRRYGATAAGQRARYYAALSAMELGQYADADKELREIAAKSGDSLEPALARLALAESARRQGHAQEAIEAYRKLVEDTRQPLPRDHALMRLASLLEETEKRAEARAAYRQLAEEFPRSVYAAQARARADALDTAQQG